MVFKKGGTAAAERQVQGSTEPQVSQETMLYAMEQIQLQKDDDALNTALHYLILANAPVWSRIQILDLRDRMGFDNKQWLPQNAPQTQ